MASSLIQQLYSQNHWLSDGSQTVYNFTFAGNPSSLTYLDRTHVKAYWDDGSGNRTPYVFQDEDFLGDYQLSVVPAAPAGKLFVIYRDTPKDKPLVDYADGAQVSEPSLDDTAKQAVFIAAEFIDGAILDNPDLGFKALKYKATTYTGASEVQPFDNGRTHYKTDGTQVTIPNTLPDEFLTTIINNGDTTLTVALDDAVAHRQGAVDISGLNGFTIPARNAVGVAKVSDGHFFVNGFITGI